MEKAFNALGKLGCPRHLLKTAHIVRYRVPLPSQREKRSKTGPKESGGGRTEKKQVWPNIVKVIYATVEFVFVLFFFLTSNANMQEQKKKKEEKNPFFSINVFCTTLSVLSVEDLFLSSSQCCFTSFSIACLYLSTALLRFCHSVLVTFRSRL